MPTIIRNIQSLEWVWNKIHKKFFGEIRKNAGKGIILNNLALNLKE